MASTALALLVFVQSVWSARLLSHLETVDRIVNGVQQRSYIVLFNDKGPSFGMNKEKLQDWLNVTFDVYPDNVQHIYEITKNFRGFSIWLDLPTLHGILEHEGIQYVEEDTIGRIDAPFTFRPDWGQVRALQKGGRQLLTIPSGLYDQGYPSGGADTETWDWTTAVYNGYRPLNRGGGAKIWIVDTGILQSHQEFGREGGGSRVTTNQDFVNTGGDGTDCNGHGTHCAGSAAGNYRGVAPGADIGNVRVLNCQGAGTVSLIIAGFNFVSNNQAAGYTNILSASLSSETSQASNDAIKAAADNGVVPVVAAGNQNTTACSRSPASSPDAIAVMAADRTDARASFSNTGPCGNVFAPGVNIHSAWYLSDDSYNTISGTSMATPLTAGSIAIYASQFGAPIRKDQVSKAITDYGTYNIVTGALLDGTPNIMINGNWN